MSLRLVTGLLFAAILMNVRSVESAEDGISQSLDLSFDLGNLINMAVSMLLGIFPGTKWCGKGNVANNNNDFGTSEQTDRCCREHDACETYITAGDTKYGLTNTASYTVSGCDCDQLLMECLVNTTKAESVPEYDKQTAIKFGALFFNVMSVQCLEQEYPLVCVKKGLEGRCNQCESDTNQTKVWKIGKGPSFPL